MVFQVMGELEIRTFDTDQPYFVISVRSPNCEMAEMINSRNRIGTLFLEFSDTDNSKYGKIFKRDDANSILCYVEAMKNFCELCICQCEAGISRSAGIAGALNKIYNGEDDYYFKRYLPNNHVYNSILAEAIKCGLL